MAKKTTRILIGLVCEKCGRQNYVTNKNKVNTPDKIELKKYCKLCRQKTLHKERQKLK